MRSFRLGVALVLGFGAVADAQNITEILDSNGDGGGNLLLFPFHITVDGAGNVYAAGFSTDNVFKAEDPCGANTVTQIADALGDGAGNGLLLPRGIAVDGAGNVYVTGRETDNVLRITPGGTITQVIGPAGDGAGNMLDAPLGVTVDAAGDVFVVAQLSNNVFKISDPGGTNTITQVMDASGDGAGNPLLQPAYLAFDGSGNMYVSACDSDNVFQVTPGGVITEILDSTGDGAGNTLDCPRAIGVDGTGNVYVDGQMSNNAFKIVDPAGANTITEIIDSTGDGNGNTLSQPCNLVVDASGNAYIAGFTSDNVFRISAAGEITEVVDSAGDGGDGPLDGPCGLAIGGPNLLYVAGGLSNNVFKVVPCEELAAVAARNAGSNPSSYVATAPVLGGTFAATVDLTTTGHTLALVVGYATSLTLPLGGGQTLLVNIADPSGELLGFGVTPGPNALFQASVPTAAAFCGFVLSSQAVHVGGGPPFALSNAQDLTLGV